MSIWVFAFSISRAGELAKAGNPDERQMNRAFGLRSGAWR
jgi:hypothetical protein